MSRKIKRTKKRKRKKVRKKKVRRKKVRRKKVRRKKVRRKKVSKKKKVKEVKLFSFKVIDKSAFIKDYDAEKTLIEILEHMRELKEELTQAYEEFEQQIKEKYIDQAVNEASKTAEDITDIKKLKREILKNLKKKAKTNGNIISINDAYEQLNRAQLKASKGAQKAGIPQIKKWVTQFDHRVRSTHSMVNHQGREINQEFDLPNPKGGIESAECPKDPNLSKANRNNCRCFMENEII